MDKKGFISNNESYIRKTASLKVEYKGLELIMY